MSTSRLDLKLTFRCNNRGVSCVQGDKRSTEADRDHDRARAEIEAHSAGCDGIVFTGGEVTLRPLVQMARAVQRARKRGVRVVLNSIVVRQSIGELVAMVRLFSRASALPRASSPSSAPSARPSRTSMTSSRAFATRRGRCARRCSPVSASGGG